MMKRFLLPVLFLLLVSPQALRAQELCGLVYYDLGVLYDTEPSPFGADSEYRPKGKRGWNDARYHAAADRYAALIDSLAMPLVALFGVENEAVALDLAARSHGDYAVVHRTSARRDGLDFALLYQADYLLPHRVESDYGLLCIEGELMGRAVTLLLINDEELVGERVDRLDLEKRVGQLILLGTTGKLPAQYRLTDGLKAAERAGRGTQLKRGVWQMRDRVCLGCNWELLRADVYAREWLFDPLTGEPLPLYRGESYRGGWSRNLPIFLYFRPADLEN